MLINFSKWCTTIYNEYFEQPVLRTTVQEGLPTTVCLGWVIAPDEHWNPQFSLSSEFTRGPRRSTFAAVFTNMHEPNKFEMKQEVKKALERLFGPLTNAPRMATDTRVDFGHCAENGVFQL